MITSIKIWIKIKVIVQVKCLRNSKILLNLKKKKKIWNF